jgi:hypothetical protein
MDASGRHGYDANGRGLRVAPSEGTGDSVTDPAGGRGVRCLELSLTVPASEAGYMIKVLYPRVNRFAFWLGWPDLVEYRHVVETDVAKLLRKGDVIRLWSWGSYDDVALHINENPPWYGCVFALRFRLCTGWHRFYPFMDGKKLKREADRLATFLHHRWFSSLECRREFRRQHPECADYSWRRLRQEGYPYYYHMR